MKKIIQFFKDYERLFVYGLFIVILVWLLSIQTCNKNSPYQNQQNTIDSLMLANQKKDSIINKKGQEVDIQTAIVTANKEAINKLSDSVFDLKRKNSKNTQTIAYLSQYIKTGIKDKIVPYKDTTGFQEFSVRLTKECDSVIKYYQANALKVPKDVEDSTKDFVFKATMGKDSFKIKEISFYDSTYIRFVTHKGGLFKRNSLGKVKFWTRKSIEAQVLHTNPYVQVNKMNSVFYVPRAKQRWGERLLITAGAAFLTFKILK